MDKKVFEGTILDGGCVKWGEGKFYYIADLNSRDITDSIQIRWMELENHQGMKARVTIEIEDAPRGE